MFQVNTCGRGHPDRQLLDAIEDGLPSLKRVVRARECECRW
jgi:hypothetical protein